MTVTRVQVPEKGVEEKMASAKGALTSTVIDWADLNWNLTVGCTKVSKACTNCWAEFWVEKRAHKNPSLNKDPLWNQPFCEVRVNHYGWAAPLHKPKTTGKVFVCPKSDLGHERVPPEVRQHVLDLAPDCPNLTFLVLTKRPETFASEWADKNMPANVWVGVTVEDQVNARRIDVLRTVPAARRFVSFEPLVGEVQCDLTGIGWVIVGGEHTEDVSPTEMKEAWVDVIYEETRRCGADFFFKQWHRGRKDKKDNKYKGRVYHEGHEKPEKPKKPRKASSATVEAEAAKSGGSPPDPATVNGPRESDVGGKARVGRALTLRSDATGAAKLVSRALKSRDATVRGMAEALDFEVAELASGRSDLEPLVEQMTANVKYVLSGTCREGWNDKVQAMIDRRYASVGTPGGT